MSRAGEDSGRRVLRARDETDRCCAETPAVAALVEDATSGRDPGFVGAPHVRVPELDLALDRESGRG